MDKKFRSLVIFVRSCSAIMELNTCACLTTARSIRPKHVLPMHQEVQESSMNWISSTAVENW